MLRFLAAAAFLAIATAALPARAQDDDWAVKRNPFDPRIVGRYKAILEKDPNDAVALKKLVALYSKHSSLDKLIAEYEKKREKEPQKFAYPLIIGHLHRQRGEIDKALAEYGKAAALRPDDPTVNLARGELFRQQRKLPEAIQAYEQALPRARSKAEKKQILRTLADLALDQKDIARARKFYEEIVAADPADVSARLDLADALSRHDLHKEALAEYRAAADKLKGDPARRVDVMSRLGREQEALGKDDDAVATYRQAMELTQKGHYLRKELTERIIEIYRKKQDIRGLIAYYEKAWPAGARGHFEWDVLARLYESTGEQDKALDAYRRAVRAAPSELDTQRRLIALLEISGRDQEVVAQYEQVIRIAPGEPRFQIELAERYFRRGDKKKALELLKAMARRFPADAGVHSALADLYSRWGEENLALREHETLVRIDSDDWTHLVNLGEQHFQRGDKQKAIEIWKRIAAAKTAEAWARLAEVYAEHDMGSEAIETYLKAIGLKPKDAALYRGLAGVLERQRRDDEAVQAWEKVLDLTGQDAAQKPVRREARARIISILHRKAGTPLIQKRQEWERRFGQTPPDLEAGYFLAEAYLKVGQYDHAERTLRKILQVAPGDLDAMHQLVTVHRALRQYEEAIALLKRLAELQPGREREYYTQIAELELALYHDDQAIAYVQKALEKSPNDPQAQERLADIYEKKEDYPKAVEAYKRAIELSPKNFKVHFTLARLYLRRGEHQSAALLYRDVIRRANDEETVRTAARKAIDLEEYLGTLGDLEKHIGPLSFLFVNKPIYRRILVEVYDRYVPPLVARARRGDEPARKELKRLGEQGLKPLLEGLADASDPAQQRIAVRVLGHLGNKNAAAPLVKLALEIPNAEPSPGPPPALAGRELGRFGEGLELESRLEALVAAGRLGDGRIIPQLAQLAKHKEKSIRVAAVWALGRTGDARALTPLLAALGDSQPPVQAMGCLGLGRLGDRRGLAKAAEVMKDGAAAADARAACAFALGAAMAQTHVPALTATLTDGNDDVHKNAAWALGRIADRGALPALLRAYFTKKGAVREAVAWAIAREDRGAGGGAPLEEDVVLARGSVDHRRLLGSLVPELRLERLDPKLLKGHESELAGGITEALSRHRDVIVRVLRDLDARDDGLALGPLTTSLGEASASDREQLARALDGIGREIAPTIEALAEHRDAEVRQLALSVASKIKSPRAPERIHKALADASPVVRLAALRAAERYVRLAGVGSTGAAPLARAVLERLGAPSWQERVAAADAAGSLGAGTDTAALARALGDASGFVREAAARSLGKLARKDGVPALLEATRDDVPEVRLAATHALVAIGDPRAAARLEALAREDPDPRVRQAAEPRRR